LIPSSTSASVNWTSDFHALKAANVISTFEILKTLRRAGPPTKLVYVTGGRSFDESDKVESILKKLSDLDGYSQNKLLSKALVKTFANREAKIRGSPHMTNIQPGLIIGTMQEGISSTENFI